MNVWTGTSPAPPVVAGATDLHARVEAGVSPTRNRVVVVEATFPFGAMIGYGLLGVALEPGDAAGAVDITVGGDAAHASDWASAITRSQESIKAGLPDEFREWTLRGLVESAAGRLTPQRLRVSHAAHGAVGSSGAVFRRLARFVVELSMHDLEELADEDLAALARERL